MEDDLLDDDTDTTLCIAPAVPTAEQPSLGGSDLEPWSFSWYKFAFVQVCHLSSDATGNRKQMLWEKGMCH